MELLPTPRLTEPKNTIYIYIYIYIYIGREREKEREREIEKEGSFGSLLIHIK